MGMMILLQMSPSMLSTSRLLISETVSFPEEPARTRLSIRRVMLSRRCSLHASTKEEKKSL